MHLNYSESHVDGYKNFYEKFLNIVKLCISKMRIKWSEEMARFPTRYSCEPVINQPLGTIKHLVSRPYGISNRVATSRSRSRSFLQSSS